VEYLEQFGQGATRATRLKSSWDILSVYEQSLTLKLIEGLSAFEGLTIRGITSANAMHRRVPTVSFTLEGHNPADLAKAFAADNIFLWSGHNYAIEPMKRMGLMETGGVLRVGLAHYNTEAEINALLASLTRQVRG